MACFSESPNDESDKLLENKTHQEQSSCEDEGKDPDSDAEEPRDNTRSRALGYTSLVVGTLGLGFGLMFSQLLDQSIPHSELNGLRYGLQFLLSIVIMAMSNNYAVWIERKSIGWAALACTSMVTSGYGAYGMSFYLPLGVATGVEGSIELVLLFLAGWILSRSGVRVPDLLATCLCLLGILLISQPHIIFRKERPSILNNTSAYHSPCSIHVFNETSSSNSTYLTTEKNGDSSAQHDYIKGGCFMALDVISSVTCALVVKYKLEKVKVTSLLFWSGLWGVVLSTVLMGITESPTMPHLTICALFLAAHIALSGSHNIFLVYGYQNVNPASVGLIITMKMPLLFILQYTALSGMYPGHANALEIAGAGLVFFANIFIPCYESIQHVRKNSENKS